LWGRFAVFDRGSHLVPIDWLEGFPDVPVLGSFEEVGEEEMRSFSRAFDLTTGSSYSLSDVTGEEEGMTLRFCLFAGGAMPAEDACSHTTSIRLVIRRLDRPFFRHCCLGLVNAT
jgi:hypothetical protein